MKKLVLVTPRETFYIHENGNIERTGMKPSGDWKFLGAEHVKASIFLPLTAIFAMSTEELRSYPWTWKNGNPQWTVRDMDHGTRRTWGNTKYHGIRTIYMEVK